MVGDLFIWDSASGAHDLDSLIAPGSGWSFLTAEAINDQGQIVGWGTKDGFRRGFRMDP